MGNLKTFIIRLKVSTFKLYGISYGRIWRITWQLSHDIAKDVNFGGGIFG